MMNTETIEQCHACAQSTSTLSWPDAVAIVGIAFAFAWAARKIF